MNAVESIPVISVVMPVFNGALYLEEAIDSILGQTFTRYELIIINDGSTDQSLSIIEKYAQKDSRIKVVNRSNKGLVSSLNEGFSLARGDFIARMDADDVSLPERFSRQLQSLNNENADLCGCHYFMIDEHGSYLDAAITPLTHESVAVFLTNTTPFAHGSVMMRRTTLNRLGCFYGMTGVKSAEDYALWVELFKRGAIFTNVDDFLFKYRDFSNSLSKSNRANVKGDAKTLSYKFVRHYEELIFRGLIQPNSKRLSNREQEISVIALLKMVLMTKRFSLLFELKRFSKRNLLCGFFRFFGRS